MSSEVQETPHTVTSVEQRHAEQILILSRIEAATTRIEGKVDVTSQAVKESISSQMSFGSAIQKAMNDIAESLKDYLKMIKEEKVEKAEIQKDFREVAKGDKRIPISILWQVLSAMTIVFIVMAMALTAVVTGRDIFTGPAKVTKEGTTTGQIIDNNTNHRLPAPPVGSDH